MSIKPQSSTISDYIQAIEQLTLLGYKEGELVFYRALADGKPPIKTKAPFPTIPNKLERLNNEGYNIYVVVNGGGDKDKDVTEGKAGYYEHDNILKEEQMVLWQVLGLPEPTFQLDTGGKSIHSYWVLDKPIAIDDWKVLQTDLLEFSDGDRTIKNPSRVMRLAGYKHQGSGETSTIVTKSGNKYSYDELRATIPTQVKPEPKTKAKSKPKAAGAPSHSSSASEDLPIDGEIPPIPLDYCLTLANQEKLKNGVDTKVTSRNFAAATLARDLLGCDNWLKDGGQPYAGVPRTLFDEFCAKCTPPIGKGEKDDPDEPNKIWKSAEDSNPTPGCMYKNPHAMYRRLKSWARENSGEELVNPPELSIAKDVYHDLFKDKIRFDSKFKEYYGYNGKGKWVKRTEEYIFKIVQDYLEKEVPCPFFTRYVDNVIKFAKGDILCEGWTEASNLRYIPFENTVYDLATKELLPHSPDYGFTWQLPRQYTQKVGNWSKIAKFIKILSGGDKELEAIAFAWCNAVLIGRSDLQKFLTLTGKGGNGKGAFLRLQAMLVGDINVHSTNLKELNESRFESANLRDKRLVVMPDEDKRVGSVSILKSATGQDPIRFEQKGKDATTFIFTGMIAIASNHPVFVGENGYAVQRRLIDFPCLTRVAEDDRRDLTPEFESELEPFTNYLLSLDNDWVTTTLRKASEVESVKKLNWENMVQSNSIAAFFEDKLVPDNSRIGTLSSSVAYKLYESYCKKHGKKAKGSKTFSGELLELVNDLGHNVIRKHFVDGTAFIGIRLRTHKDNANLPTPDDTTTYIDWNMPGDYEKPDERY